MGFIQDHVVYRLVWAVEASRLHLQHLRGMGDSCPGGDLALCLTYGVPSVKAVPTTLAHEAINASCMLTSM